MKISERLGAITKKIKCNNMLHYLLIRYCSSFFIYIFLFKTPHTKKLTNIYYGKLPILFCIMVNIEYCKLMLYL